MLFKQLFRSYVQFNWVFPKRINVCLANCFQYRGIQNKIPAVIHQFFNERNVSMAENNFFFLIKEQFCINFHMDNGEVAGIAKSFICLYLFKKCSTMIIHFAQQRHSIFINVKSSNNYSIAQFILIFYLHSRRWFNNYLPSKEKTELFVKTFSTNSILRDVKF